MNPVARALTLSEETDLSGSEISQTIYADGDFGPSSEEKDPPYNIDFAYGYQRTSTPNPGLPNIVDHTTTLGFGLGWDIDANFGLLAKLNYANTPEEKLTAEGAQLSGSYHHAYDRKTTGFSPYLNFRLIGAITSYAESYVGSKRQKKKTVAVAGTSRLQQDMIGFATAWKPVRRWRFEIEYDQYAFNRNVAAFEANLDSAAAVQRGTSGFSSTVGVLARNAISGSATWEFTEGWRIGVSEISARVAADGSVSSTTRVTLSDQIAEEWKVTVGYLRLESNVFSDTLGLIGVEFAR